MAYQDILDGIYNEVIQIENTGKVADYIPELAKVDANKFGIALVDKHQNVFTKGDALEKFSIQSISKVITTSLIFSKIGNELWERVGYSTIGERKWYSKKSVYKCRSFSYCRFNVRAF